MVLLVLDFKTLGVLDFKECYDSVLSSGHYSVLQCIALSSFDYKGTVRGGEERTWIKP